MSSTAESPDLPLADAAPAAPDSPTVQALTERLDSLLPQTQCMRCGYDDCRAYARALARGEAELNRCPPGGAEGVQRLATALGRAPLPLDPACGLEGPVRLARIDESWCIGCTLCIEACPVDCIVGAPKQMHEVIREQCTGCELCLGACPVDCIVMDPPERPEASGWAAWSPAEAQSARIRYLQREHRREHAERENDARLAAKAQTKLADLAAHSRHTDPEVLERKRQVIEAALARARAKAAAHDGGR